MPGSISYGKRKIFAEEFVTLVKNEIRKDLIGYIAASDELKECSATFEKVYLEFEPELKAIMLEGKKRFFLQIDLEHRKGSKACKRNSLSKEKIEAAVLNAIIRGF